MYNKSGFTCESKLNLATLPASRGNSITTPTMERTTLHDIINRIQSDAELARCIQTLRATDNPDQRKTLKQQLPFFNLGIFRENQRRSDALLSSEFMVFDYDHVRESLPSLQARLEADPSLFFLFISPSGDGLKAVYRLDRVVTSGDEFSAIYKHYVAEFEAKYGFKPDKTSDVNRATFFSSDPDLYLNTDAVPLAASIPKQAAPATITPTASGGAKADITYVPSAVTYLQTRLKGYGNWYRCGMALATLGERGRPYFQTLSQNPNYNDKPEAIDAKFDELLANTHSVGLATLFSIAKDYGYVYPDLNASLLPGQTDFASELEARFKLDDTRDPNKLLGFELTKFPELAKNIDGLQPAYYHLAAETNVGKTALITNLTLDVLDTNPDVTVLYFSLDDSRIYTAYRFISIMTQFHINLVKKRTTDAVQKAAITAARQKLLGLLRSGRLLVKDIAEVQHIDHIEALVKDVPDPSKLVVFIDGLYNLEVCASGSIREENIERAKKMKQVVDTYRIPLISTGELRKRIKEEGANKKPTVHDLMETGKFAYNANVVWLLYADKATDLSSDAPTLTLEYAKNKLSDYKGVQNLAFTRSTGTMKEVSSMFTLQAPVKPFS